VDDNKKKDFREVIGGARRARTTHDVAAVDREVRDVLTEVGNG